MNRCIVPTCLRAAIPHGNRCDAHTRALQTGAFGKPEWVRRAEESRLPVRVSAA
jgi:hypothetical protein